MITTCTYSLHPLVFPFSLLSPMPPSSSSYRSPVSTRLLLQCRKSRSSLSGGNRRTGGIVCGFLPVDPWAPNIDSPSLASQLSAISFFPYLGFLYFITKSNSTPKLTLFGFYFLLAFVAAASSCYLFGVDYCLDSGAVPAGIYAKVSYGTSLSNVDWLHGGAESLLTLTNLFVVLGLREALRRKKD